MTMEIRELKTEEDWVAAWPVLRQLRRSLARERFLLNRERLLSEGYRLIGLYADGALTAVAGFVFYPHVTHGRDIWVHDLVTDESHRSLGTGRHC